MGYHASTSWIIRLPLAPTARWVLVCMNDMGWPCWPSIDKLSKITGVPRRSLERVLGMLRKGGVLKASGNGKSLTWELVEPPAEVVPQRDNPKRTMRHRGADRRHHGASGAPPWRTTCATMAHGSEPENEPEKEQGVRPLAERRATPPDEDPPGTQYVDLAAVLRAREAARSGTVPNRDPLSILEALQQAHGAGVPPPAGHGNGVAGGSDAQRAQARLAELRSGRLYA